jgi:hypothetical protein
MKTSRIGPLFSGKHVADYDHAADDANDNPFNMLHIIPQQMAQKIPQCTADDGP